MIDLSRTRTVFIKELIDNLRDRKAWLMAALYVVMGPLMLLVVVRLAGRVLADENTRAIALPVLGEARAPSLLDYLKQRNIVPVPGPSDPERAVRERQHVAVLVIPPDYARDVAEGRPAVVQLFHDSSRNQTENQVHRILDGLHGYGATIGHLRLIARGIDPSVTRAIAIEDVDGATPYSRAAFLFGLIPIFLLMSLFVGGLYIAIDTTAGERERGSLEPLLLNPLRTAELIVGKLAAVATFSTATVLLTIAGFAIVLNCAPMDIPRVRMGLSALGVLGFVVILLPAVYLAATLQIRLASTRRTFKEAQTAGQLLMLIPALPGMLELLGTVELGRAKYLPIVGQQLLIEAVLKGQSMSWSDWAITSMVSVAAGVLMTYDTVRRYDRAAVLFG